MSEKYIDLSETNFPNSVDFITRMSDVSAEDKPLVLQYYAYLNAGNDASAAALLDSNPSLQTKIFNAAKFNKVADGIVALQRYFIDELQTYLNEQLTYKEPYNASTTYKKTNIVSYNGEGFICRVNSSKGVAPVSGTTTTNWAIISKQGVQGVSGTGLSPKGGWSSLSSYYKDDCVVYNNSLWQCLVDNTNSEPNVSNTNWVLMFGLSTTGSSVLLSGYEKPTAASPILSSDTVNLAIGKLEKSVEISQAIKSAIITSSWNGAIAPFTQVISVTGISSSDNPIVFPVYSSDLTTAISEKTAWNLIGKIETGDGSLTVTCFNEKPTTAVNIRIKGV